MVLNIVLKIEFQSIYSESFAPKHYRGPTVELDPLYLIEFFSTVKCWRELFFILVAIDIVFSWKRHQNTNMYLLVRQAM